ncbi:MAG: RNA polymerase sigma factor [Bacteroides sp.]|nr:RNA polymerase sigma factor [Bacteroides sp.]
MREIDFRRDVLPLKDKLFRLAYRITFDRMEAEDIVQETMIRVWNKRDEIGEVGSIEAFCLVITRNLAIDRSQKKEAQNVKFDAQTENISESIGPYENLIRKERLDLIDQLIGELPEKQRTIIQLRDMEGYTYKEIAELLELPEEQVKVNLFRARQKIKHQYKKIDGYGL